MNTSQLLQTSISDLQLILNKLQQQLADKQQIILHTVPASSESLVELVSFAELDSNADSINLNEIQILEGEIEIINTVINYKQGKTSTSRLDELVQTIRKVSQENAILRTKIAKYKMLEHEMRDYMRSQQTKQHQLQEQHRNIIEHQLASVIDIRSKYPKIKSYNSHIQHLFSWICHRKLNDTGVKAKRRNQQITHLEDLANMLSNDSAHGIVGTKFHELLIYVSTKVGIGYTDDESTSSTASLDLCDNERQTLINVIKTLILYGGLTNIERQITAEYNLAPSRLLTLISAVKQQLSLDVYNLSEGLIDHKIIAEKSTDTYEHFMANLKLCKPRPEYKAKARATNSPY